MLCFGVGLVLGRLEIAKLRLPWEVQHSWEWILALGSCAALYCWGIYYPLSLLLGKRAETRSEPPKTSTRRSSWPLAYSNKMHIQ